MPTLLAYKITDQDGWFKILEVAGTVDIIQYEGRAYYAYSPTAPADNIKGARCTNNQVNNPAGQTLWIKTVNGKAEITPMTTE